jgi:hypothetical protein
MFAECTARWDEKKTTLERKEEDRDQDIIRMDEGRSMQERGDQKGRTWVFESCRVVGHWKWGL